MYIRDLDQNQLCLFRIALMEAKILKQRSIELPHGTEEWIISVWAGYFYSKNECGTGVLVPYYGQTYEEGYEWEIGAVFSCCEYECEEDDEEKADFTVWAKPSEETVYAAKKMTVEQIFDASQSELEELFSALIFEFSHNRREEM